MPQQAGVVLYSVMVVSALPTRPRTRHQATARPPVVRMRRVASAPLATSCVDALDPQQEPQRRDAAGRFAASRGRGTPGSAPRPHAGRNATVKKLESKLAAAQTNVLDEHRARRSAEEQLLDLQVQLKQERVNKKQTVKELKRQHEARLQALEDKDKQLAGLRAQLDRARKDATLQDTRRHLADLKRKHEDIKDAHNEALQVEELHGNPNTRVLKLPRRFSRWSANNAASAIGEFLESAAARAVDAGEGVKLQRHVAAKLVERFQPADPTEGPCYGPCCRRAVETAVSEIQEHYSPRLGSSLKAKCKNSDRQHQRLIRGLGQWFDPVTGRYRPRKLSIFDIDFPQMASNRAIKAWRGDVKDVLGVEHEVLEGKVVTAGVPIGMAVANRIRDLGWSGYQPDYEQHPPHVQGIVDSASAYRGVKQTTGVCKVVRFDGEENNSLRGNCPVILYEGDDAYEVLAEKGKRFFDEMNEMAINGVTLQDGTHVPVFVCEGGDNKYQNASGGQCGCSATKVCHCAHAICNNIVFITSSC